jgi:hypothetical protein
MIITNARRENERRIEIKEFREKLDTDLNKLLQNSSLILETWKIIIERELKRRK